MSEGRHGGNGSIARLVATVGVWLCSACMVGPDYKPPAPSPPPPWPAVTMPGEDQSVDVRWWKTFGDPMLEDLVARAITGNRDVAATVARVRAARVQRTQATASLFPSIDALAGYERRRSPAVSSAASSTGAPVDVGDRSRDGWSAGFDASWEIDLFGGIRRSHEQASAAFEAAGADLRDALVSVAAEVARNYVELRSLEARIQIADHNARSQEGTLQLARWRFEAGLASALDVEQAGYNLAETRSRIPALEADHSAAANRLAVLVGVHAGSLDPELARPRAAAGVPRRIAIGAPLDLLRRRPDIAAAERRLAAATSAIGVATAELYPRLTLSGTFTLDATDIATLGSNAARGYSIGPALRWNIFDAGRLRSIVAQRSAEADEALAKWEAEVLAAYEEARSALVAFAKEQERRDRLATALAAARSAHGLARMQYESGLVDFQQVLEAERALLGFEESLAISEAAVTSNLVALYKSLGGGWEMITCDDDGCR